MMGVSKTLNLCLVFIMKGEFDMAADLTSYRASSVGAEETLFFLEVPTDMKSPETKAFHMAFLRQEASSIDTGVETETIADVTQKTQPTEVKSYSPTQEFSGLFLKTDPVCIYLQHLYDTRAVGGKAHCNHLEVRKWAEGGNVAFKSDVTVSISSITNEAGNQRMISGTFGFAGDPEEGTATIADDTGIATYQKKAE